MSTTNAWWAEVGLIQAGYLDRIFHHDLALVFRLYDDVLEAPLAGILNGSGCPGGNVEILQDEIFERRILVGCHRKRLPCGRALDARDAHLAQVGQSL